MMMEVSTGKEVVTNNMDAVTIFGIVLFAFIIFCAIRSLTNGFKFSVKNKNIQVDNAKVLEYKKLIDNNESLKRINIIRKLLLILVVILSVLDVILAKKLIAKLVMPLILVIYLIYIIINYKKQNKIYNEINSKQKELEERIRILEENKQKQIADLEKIEKEYNANLSKIKNESGINNLDNLLELIDRKQSKINEETLNLHTLKIDNNNITPKLEKLVNIEEELENLQEEKQELEEKRENIKRAAQYLEIAYDKMKEQITPKFTEELSNVMEKISDGKYKNVRINTEGDIIVEQNNGEYINAQNLSIGTIDQLYLSLRLATAKEITKENMPIILDEAFAYYDNERLENILKYLSKKYSGKQIIIFTCTKREKETLEKNNIRFNLIEL